MIRNEDRVRGFGIEFKFNTGRAIAYIYDQPVYPPGPRHRLATVFEDYFRPNIFDDWPKYNKGACVANHRDVILTKIKKWDRDFELGGLQFECLILVKYISLVVPYNYEFHFRVKLTTN